MNANEFQSNCSWFAIPVVVALLLPSDQIAASDAKPSVAPGSTVIAVVNVQAAMDTSKKYSAEFAEIKTAEDDIRIVAGKESRELAAAYIKLRTLGKGSVEAIELQKRIDELTMANTQRGEARAKLDSRRREARSAFFVDFKIALQEVVKLQGIDIVVRVDVPAGEPEIILHYSDRVDITSEIVKRIK